ncbi:MAG: enolase C-terminal domain-like protein [Hymenobacter sp.]
MRAVAAALPGHPLLVDGNEAWPDADGVLRFLEAAAAVPGLQMRFLEQPLPAALAADYRYLRPRTSVPLLLADESVTDEADFAEIARQFHGVNVKLMKAGGYQRGIELLRQTRAHGLLPMLGCMVETSLGIWSALQISALADVHDLDGILIVRDEPFGLVREEEALGVPDSGFWQGQPPLTRDQESGTQRSALIFASSSCSCLSTSSVTGGLGCVCCSSVTLR